MDNIILVDTSYTAFYRFFATMKWYSMAFKEEAKLIKQLIITIGSRIKILWQNTKKCFFQVLKNSKKESF